MSSKFLHDLEVSRMVREFSPDHWIDVSPILEAIRWAPTAWGIQPFVVRIVSNADVKKELCETASGQNQLMSCSHVLVLEARTDVHEVIAHYIKERHLDELDREFASSIRCHFHGFSPEAFHRFASDQIYICLGYALAAADTLGMGACPVGGFDTEKVAAVLRSHDKWRATPTPTPTPPTSQSQPNVQGCTSTPTVPVIMLTLGTPATEPSTVPPAKGSQSSNQPVSGNQLSKFRLPLTELCTYCGN